MLSESRMQAKKEEKATIKFQCANCQLFLFTNLDVTTHEPQTLNKVVSAKAIKPFKEELIRACSIASEDETMTSMVMDPALNLKYKCQNIFTHKLEWMQEEHYKQDYGFLTCPGEKCETKLGIFSYEGIRC